MTNNELQEELQDISYELEGASGGLQMLMPHLDSRTRIRVAELVVAVEDAISEVEEIREAM